MVVVRGVEAAADVTEVLGLAPVSEEGLIKPANKKKMRKGSHAGSELERSLIIKINNYSQVTDRLS